LLSDLSNFTETWGRQSNWYQGNWDGGVYQDKVFGIWAWTDVRGIWYWKDMLEESGVEPQSLMTWEGYIDAARKLNSALRPHGIEGVHLTGAGHSPDLWYPYLWMLGGEIVSIKQGHPTKGTYWYPSFNDTEGVRAAIAGSTEAYGEGQRYSSYLDVVDSFWFQMACRCGF
jgi:multiple sugar transport system substrate-binding protein